MSVCLDMSVPCADTADTARALLIHFHDPNVCTTNSEGHLQVQSVQKDVIDILSRGSQKGNAVQIEIVRIGHATKLIAVAGTWKEAPMKNHILIFLLQSDLCSGCCGSKNDAGS